MGFWPFGGGKRQRVVESDDHGRESLLRRAPSDNMARREKQPAGQSSPGRNSSKNRREEGPRRLSKIRTQGSKDVVHTQPVRSQTTPLAPSVDPRGSSRRSSQYNEKTLYRQNPVSQTSIGPEIFTVTQAPPTLHAKRAETDTQIPRRKSSKRKAEDYAREREIKAMSSSSPIPIPKRPNTFYAAGPLQRDSRQIPGPLNRRLERPTSEISLPIPGSLAEINDMSNQNSFKIGIFAALSPRPTVRYDANPRLSASKQSIRPNMAIRQAIEEEDISDKKRIDDLADDLDAGGLRELLERDRRRRERKKEADKAKLQRRLQRRAERQREEEARRARTEAYVRASPTSPQRGQAANVAVSSIQQVNSSQTPRNPEYEPTNSNPFEDPGPSTIHAHEAIRNPFEDEKDMDIMENPQDSEDNVEEATPVPVRSPMRKVTPEVVKPKHRPSQSTLSPPVSPVNRAVDRSSMSQGSLLNREITPDIPESASLERRTSEQSSQRLGSWTSFFRRGTRGKFTGPPQGRTTPSEFSNTSRESFSRKQPPVATPRTFRRSNSGTPQRTLSRFREDLPELPISPPDSRVQSPEAGFQPRSASQQGHSQGASTSSMNAHLTGGTPAIQILGNTGHRRQKESEDLDATTSNAPDVALSRSLASVDSEGSWLSGKPPKRLSGQLSHAVKPSLSSLQPHVPGAFSPMDDDEDDLMDDEYYNRLSPTPQDRRPSTERRASSTIIDLQNEQEQTSVPDLPPTPKFPDEKWHQGAGRQPTLVQQADRAKSKEGLLKEYTADAPTQSSTSSENGDEQDPESPVVVTGEMSVMRARSVDYKNRHARHMSAGSAKLLDIRRASVHSDASYPRSPTHIPRKSDLALHIEHPVPTTNEQSAQVPADSEYSS